MSTVFKIAALVSAALLLIFLAAWYSFGLQSFFAPRQEALRNQVFHESQSYNDGMVRDLENIQMQYEQGAPAAKGALRDIALHRFAGYPADRLTPELRTFYNQLKAAQ